MDSLPSRFVNEIPDESVEKNEMSEIEKDEFEFNQDFEIEENIRSPGWLRYQKRIK